MPFFSQLTLNRKRTFYQAAGLLVLLIVPIIISNRAIASTAEHKILIPVILNPEYYSLELAYDGFDVITDINHAPDDNRFFVTQKNGIIWAVNPDKSRSVFLDIGDRVRTNGERGLLGTAFHPDFASNGYFYVTYTSTSGHYKISRFSINVSSGQGDIATEQTLIAIGDQSPLHNGGQIKFNPLDGYLYASIGDDQEPEKAQSTTILKGKILRFAVGDGSAFPAPDIVALGLRNPWRFAFDQQTGDIFIGDVGFDKFEEVNLVEAGEIGRNFGWPCMRGTNITSESGICENHLRFIRPIYHYTHFGSPDSGCSITMGLVDNADPEHNPRIVFSDYCEGDIRLLEKEAGIWKVRIIGELPDDLFEITSFGRQRNGTILFGTYKGTIYELHLPQ